MKNEATLQAIGQLKGLAGRASCSYCGHAEEASAVYSGSFDFAESDEFIRRLGVDQANVRFDDASKRWFYRGELVALKSDIQEGETTTEGDSASQEDGRRIFYLGPGSPSDDF